MPKSATISVCEPRIPASRKQPDTTEMNPMVLNEPKLKLALVKLELTVTGMILILMKILTHQESQESRGFTDSSPGATPLVHPILGVGGDWKVQGASFPNSSWTPRVGPWECLFVATLQFISWMFLPHLAPAG